MDIRNLTGGLSIAPQNLAADLLALRAAGFKAILCNRPGGEGLDQPDFAEIEAAARDRGRQARHWPAESGQVSDTQGAGAFDAATTASTMASVLPRGVNGIKAAMAACEWLAQPERVA